MLNRLLWQDKPRLMNQQVPIILVEKFLLKEVRHQGQGVVLSHILVEMLFLTYLTLLKGKLRLMLGCGFVVR